MRNITFRAACCERFGVSPETFEKELLWHCVPRRAVGLGKLIWRLRPSYFEPDLELIRDVSQCTSASAVQAELNCFRYRNRTSGFCRKVLGVRLSGRQLVKLAAESLH